MVRDRGGASHCSEDMNIYGGGDGCFIGSDEPIPISDKWHHIAGTYKNGAIELYLDGKKLNQLLVCQPTTQYV